MIESFMLFLAFSGLILVGLWLFLIMFRFGFFFLKVVYYSLKGKNERRVIAHWFFGKERLAPASDIAPFVLPYEIEREYFWEKLKAGEKVEMWPRVLMPEGTFPRWKLKQDLEVLFYWSVIDAKQTEYWKRTMSWTKPSCRVR